MRKVALAARSSKNRKISLESDIPCVSSAGGSASAGLGTLKPQGPMVYLTSTATSFQQARNTEEMKIGPPLVQVSGLWLLPTLSGTERRAPARTLATGLCERGESKGRPAQPTGRRAQAGASDTQSQEA